MISEYLAHLRAQGRAETTIKKHTFGCKLIQDLAARRGLSRINQLDLAFVDAFQLARATHRVKPGMKNDVEGQTENNAK